MMSYATLRRKPRILRCFTGLSRTAFERLLSAFCQAEAAASQQQEAQRTTPRQRQAGGGRKPILLESADRLLFILFF